MKGLVIELLRIAKELVEPRSYDSLLSDVRDAVSDLGYSEKVLGSIGDDDVILFRPKSLGSRKRILIVAGQHGEEPAGPWALVKFLSENQELLKKVAVSFIPVANIHGFLSAERNGIGGGKTNWFLTEDKKIRKLSKEAQILYDHFEFLGDCAKDGLLNLHEDNTSEGFYLYVLGDSGSKVVKDMLSAGKRHFNFKRDGVYDDNETYELKDGVVENYEDGSFDEAMVLEFDIPIAVTIETPERNAAIEDRVKASSAMAAVFVRGVMEGADA